MTAHPALAGYQDALEYLFARTTGVAHNEELGSTVEEIAREKAGIFRPGRPAVIGERVPHIRDFLAERAMAVGASSVRIASDEFELHSVEVKDAGTTCDVEWKG